MEWNSNSNQQRQINIHFFGCKRRGHVYRYCFCTDKAIDYRLDNKDHLAFYVGSVRCDEHELIGINKIKHFFI